MSLAPTAVPLGITFRIRCNVGIFHPLGQRWPVDKQGIGWNNAGKIVGDISLVEHSIEESYGDTMLNASRLSGLSLMMLFDVRFNHYQACNVTSYALRVSSLS